MKELPNNPPHAISNEDKAWLAGFIDGEGYIGITFQIKHETKESAASPRYHPYLVITNTNRESLEQIKLLLGCGNVHVVSKKSDKRKESYQYRISHMDHLYLILGIILPYLKIKHKQCKILMGYIERRKKIKPITGRGYRGITSFDQTDKAIYDKLLLLNKKGN